MYDEPRPMKEIHDVQRKLYEEEKHLSRADRIAKIHREAEAFAKKHGIKVRRASHAH